MQSLHILFKAQFSFYHFSFPSLLYSALFCWLSWEQSTCRWDMVVACKQIHEWIIQCDRGSIGTWQTPGVFDEITILNICRHLTQLSWLILHYVSALLRISSCSFFFYLFLGWPTVWCFNHCRIRQPFALSCCLISAFFHTAFQCQCRFILVTDQLLPKILTAAIVESNVGVTDVYLYHVFFKCLFILNLPVLKNNRTACLAKVLLHLP